LVHSVKSAHHNSQHFSTIFIRSGQWWQLPYPTCECKNLEKGAVWAAAALLDGQALAALIHYQ
jgi:hypothetical protein